MVLLRVPLRNENSSPSPSLKYYNITWDTKQIFGFYWAQVLWHECLISLEDEDESQRKNYNYIKFQKDKTQSLCRKENLGQESKVSIWDWWKCFDILRKKRLKLVWINKSEGKHSGTIITPDPSKL